MRRTTTLVTGAAAALVLALAGCSGNPLVPQPSGSQPTTSVSPPGSASATATGDLSAFYGQRLTWKGCGGDFDCTTLTVPVDYAHPGGATLKLNVVRLKAGKPSKRVGSLVLNPGGPGGSGVEYARAARAIIDASVRDVYDVVGFDPRGVASSAPIRCLTDKQTDTFIAADGTPDVQAEVDALDRYSKQMADLCASRNPVLVGHVGTVDAARDVDVLRAALGDQKLYWLGASYGTFLGATYADLFPTHVGRMVLDGAIDPTLSNADLTRGQAKGFEVALQRFVQDCPKEDGCPLPADPQAALDRIQSFFDELDAHPLPAGGGRVLTQALAQNAVLSYLYFPPSDWEQLRFGLSAAFDGDGSVLMSMLDQRLERDENGHYRNNSFDALYAVNALDRTDRPGVVEVQQMATEWAKEAPHWGAFLAWGNLAFHYWKAPASDTAHAITAPGAPPILVVGTTYDPATPYPWAQALAKQLSSGVLLTRVGDGHTAYGMGSACADQAIDRYLVTGTPPAAGTVCH